jgi:hypothetical protein
MMSIDGSYSVSGVTPVGSGLFVKSPSRSAGGFNTTDYAAIYALQDDSLGGFVTNRHVIYAESGGSSPSHSYVTTRATGSWMDGIFQAWAVDKENAQVHLAQGGQNGSTTTFGIIDRRYGRLTTSGAVSNGLLVGTKTSDPLVFGTNDIERIRIDSNGNVGIASSAPNEKLVVGGNIWTASQGKMRFGDANNSNFITLKTNKSIPANMTWTLPAADGANGQFLTTNGAGVMYWSGASTGGISTINGQAASAQNLAVSSGSATLDWSFAGSTHTLNLPIAGSGSSFGMITSAISAQWNSAVTGTGITNYVTKFGAASNSIVQSQIFDNGTNVGIGTTGPNAKLHVQGSVQFGDTTNSSNLSIFGNPTSPNGLYGQAKIYDDTAAAQGVGGGLMI